MRKEAGADDAVPALMEPVLTSRAFRKNWSRLIRKVYHVDPLLCPKCRGTMKISDLRQSRRYDFMDRSKRYTIKEYWTT